MNEFGLPFFSIGYSELNRIEIQLLSPPANKETEGYGWVVSKAVAKSGSFSGEANLNLTKEDIEDFHRSLQEVYTNTKGISKLTTIEDQISITVSMNEKGQVVVTGYLKEDAGSRTTLHFEFGFDQTDVKKTISEIGRALSEIETLKG